MFARVYVCMCVFMHVYMYVCNYVVCMYELMQSNAENYFPFVCIYVFVSMHARILVYLYVCMYVCNYVYMYICGDRCEEARNITLLHVYVYICMCMYILMYQWLAGHWGGAPKF